MWKQVFFSWSDRFLMLFISACSYSRTEPGTESAPTTTYAIGDTGPGGGIVFYVTDGGLRGLEAAPAGWNDAVPADVSQVSPSLELLSDPTSAWITGGSTRTTSNGNTETGIGTGLANSNFIISQSGHTASAAQLCRAYDGGGFTDWFLPSQEELAQMISALASTAGLRTTYGFTGSNYWSSSERSATTAFLQTPGGYDNKSSTSYLRPVRAFSPLDRVTLADIQATTLSSANINGSDNSSNMIPTGTIVVYKTQTGRYGKFLVVTLGYDLLINWVTYNLANDGTIYSQGQNLTIGGTYSANLDNGTQVSSGDFFWNQVSSILRYIVPENSATFAVYP